MNYRSEDLVSALPLRSLKAGVRLAEEGRVRMVEARPTEGRVFGLVRGERGSLLRASARCIPTGTGAPIVSGTCSCSRRSDCEHIAALLWEAQDPAERIRGRAEIERRKPEAHWVGGDSDPGLDPDTGRVSKARVGRFAAPAPEEDWRIREWTERMRRELGARDARPQPGSGQFLLVYLLDSEPGRGAGAPCVVSLKPTLLAVLKNGNFGREKSFDWHVLEREPRPLYLQEGDEQALMAVETARLSRAYGFPHRAPVELSPARAAFAIERALETGRCYWRSRGGASLKRGPARVGRLAWELDDAGQQRPAVHLAELPDGGGEGTRDGTGPHGGPGSHGGSGTRDDAGTPDGSGSHGHAGPHGSAGPHNGSAPCEGSGPHGSPGPLDGAETRDSSGPHTRAGTADARIEILPLAPPWYVNVVTGECGPIETGLKPRAVASFLAAPALTPEAAARVGRDMAAWDKGGVLPSPKALRIAGAAEAPVPVPRILLHGIPLDLSGRFVGRPGDPPLRVPAARLSFSYGAMVVDAFDPRPELSVLEGDAIHRIHRNHRAESAAVNRLESFDLFGLGEREGGLGPIAITWNRGGSDLPGVGEKINDFIAPDEEDPVEGMLEFVIDGLPRLQRDGWIIETDPSFPCRLLDPDSAWYADIDETAGQKWFDLEMGVTVDGEKISLLPVLLRLLREQAGSLSPLDPNGLDANGSGANGSVGTMGVVIPLEDGRLLPVPAERLRRIVRILGELYDDDGLPAGNGWRMSLLQTPALAGLDEEAEELGIALRGGEVLRELGRRLRDFSGIASVEPPSGLHGVLRAYQGEGVSWLQFLRANGLGGLLADDMGLGKTIQGLAHILIEKESGRADRPSLVVAPTSLMVNWQREAARFAPGLRVLTLHGPDRHARFESVAKADIVLTTYPLLWRDKEALLDREYHLLILDEAQFLKNHRTKGARVAREVRARQRLCFTGTPFENRLMELWALFDILMPGLLGDEKRFRKVFASPIEKRGDAEKRARLSARIKPFLLRRTRDKVATELPPRTEIVQAVDLSEGQRDLYETIRLAMHSRVRAEIAKRGFNRAQIVILDALLKLRQVCCDPRLVKLPKAREVRESAKLDALIGMIEEMTSEGRRILLFSQFTSMLDLIEPELVSRKITFVRLTGATRDRATPVAAFQEGKTGVFLISLKAGGTGLNLTAADTVILYDPWWNPAVEDQATGRAHRIGQNKPVFTYKLIAAGSVEEKIVAMQARKRDLVRSVLAPGENAGILLTEEDLEALFQPLAP